MPRVEIIPAGWETSQEKADGNGTPTIDVCAPCWSNEYFYTGEYLSNSNADMSECKQYPLAKIGETNVEHPSYSEDDYKCACCGEKLTDDDN